MHARLRTLAMITASAFVLVACGSDGDTDLDTVATSDPAGATDSEIDRDDSGGERDDASDAQAEADATATPDTDATQAVASTQHDGDPVGEPADPTEATRTIEVDAFEMAFGPESVTVEPGEIVTFVVTNTGEIVHEFTLGDEQMQQKHAAEMAGDGHVHDGPNVISVDPGETKELTWRFGGSGTLEYGCHEPGHYNAGMVGTIVVG